METRRTKSRPTQQRPSTATTTKRPLPFGAQLTPGLMTVKCQWRLPEGPPCHALFHADQPTLFLDHLAAHVDAYFVWQHQDQKRPDRLGQGGSSDGGHGGGNEGVRKRRPRRTTSTPLKDTEQQPLEGEDDETMQLDGETEVLLYHCQWLGCEQKSCTKRWHMKRHVMGHNPFPLFECKVCSETFKRKYDLLHHARIKHPQEEIDKKMIQRRSSSLASMLPDPTLAIPIGSSASSLGSVHATSSVQSMPTLPLHHAHHPHAQQPHYAQPHAPSLHIHARHQPPVLLSPPTTMTTTTTKTTTDMLTQGLPHPTAPCKSIRLEPLFSSTIHHPADEKGRSKKRTRSVPELGHHYHVFKMTDTTIKFVQQDKEEEVEEEGAGRRGREGKRGRGGKGRERGRTRAMRREG